MLVYRICDEEEIKKIVNGISFHDIGYYFTLNPDLNTHQYKSNIKYLHFFESYDSIFYLNVTNGYYICTYNIPNEILDLYSGMGLYLDRLFFKSLEEVPEYAIPSDEVKNNYLERIDKVTDYIDFEDYIYGNYVDNLINIYQYNQGKEQVIKKKLFNTSFI